jgi:hypothetical protein
VDEIGVPGENHQPAASQWQTLSHKVVLSTPRPSRIRIHNLGGDRHWLHMITIPTRGPNNEVGKI